MTYTSTSLQHTIDIASKFSHELSKGDVICFYGELGAGKTAFTKGLLFGLGCNDIVTSPTFTIVNEYFSGRIPIYHFDVYRIISADELEGIAFYDYFSDECIIIIEWAKQIEEVLCEIVQPHKRVNIKINIEDENLRTINIVRGYINEK